MAFIAKDKIVRTGDDLNLSTLVNLQADATPLAALADTAITTAQTGLAMTSTNRLVKVARVALANVNTGGGIFSWANPEASAVLIDRVVVDVTTKATAACAIDIGTTATNGTTSSDNLIDGLDVNNAVGVFDNITDKGTNGKSRQKINSGKWVTASVSGGGASAGLVGFAYIHYVVI